MTTADKNSVIHRKAKGGREEFNARVMSPDKALRLSLAKVADKLFDLAVTVTTVEQVLMPHADIRSQAGDDGLLVLLDGASGRRGAVKVDTQFLSALIEVQTIGKVREAEADARSFTRTDAAIMAPLVDAVMRGFDEQIKSAQPDYVVQAYRFGDMMEDARALSLALEAPKYDLFRLTVDIEDGAKTGILLLMLPEYKQVSLPGKPAKVSGGRGGVKLEKHALNAQVAMDAVLARISMPLKQICELKPGMHLPVAAGCLGEAELVAAGGYVVAQVSMGRLNGLRAIRLVSDESAAAGGEHLEQERAGAETQNETVLLAPGDVLDDPADLLSDTPDEKFADLSDQPGAGALQSSADADADVGALLQTDPQHLSEDA